MSTMLHHVAWLACQLVLSMLDRPVRSFAEAVAKPRREAMVPAVFTRSRSKFCTFVSVLLWRKLQVPSACGRPA